MLEGVTYTMTLLSDGALCPPGGGMKNLEALKIVVKYLEDRPADLYMESSRLLFSQIGKVFVPTVAT